MQDSLFTCVLAHKCYFANMKLMHVAKLNIPSSPGVYFFKKNGLVLYIGKATSLKDRVKSYFDKDLIETRGVHILDMVSQSDDIHWQETGDALSALVLESELIKKFQPKYNTKEKDNKSFNYVVITKEEIPKVLLIRGRNIKVEQELNSLKIQYKFGPFISGESLKEGLKIIRRIFPFIDRQSAKKDNFEFYKQLGLNPDLSKNQAILEYKNNIKHIVMFLKGKNKELVSNLNKEMKKMAKEMKFERANEIKKKIFALQHIRDVAMIKSDFYENPEAKPKEFRIEGYDMAHISGKSYVGVMTVVENGVVDKNEYRKFNIKSVTASDDVGALKEVLLRRLKHPEWRLPEMIVVDGSKAQRNTAEKVLAGLNLKIPVVSVVKDDRHKARDIEYNAKDTDLRMKHEREILLVNSEAHRFAIKFHREKRGKSFIF